MEDKKENCDDVTFVREETIKTPTKLGDKITKQFFNSAAKSRTKKLVDKALSLQRKRNLPVKILEDQFCLNDTADFQNGPRVRNGKSRLRLKSSASSSLKNGSLDRGVLNSDMEPSCSKDIKNNADNVLKDIDSSHSTVTENALSKKSREIVSEKIPNVFENVDKNQENLDRKTCLLCGIGIVGTLYKDHKTKCLRDNFAKDSDPEKVSGETSEVRRCQICNMDISHLNIERQSRHLNKCIDKDIANHQSEEVHQKQLQVARTSVLGCPMCGRKLKTQTSWQSHLKKCAVSNKMTVDQLKNLIRQQEEEHHAKLDAGVLPEDFVVRKGKEKSSKTSKPKTQLDEDTELALALSTSLAEDRKEQEMDFISLQEGHLGVRPLCSEQEVVQGKGKRNKGKQADSPCLLTTLPRDKAMERISHRVDKYIFSESCNDEHPSTPPFNTGKKTHTLQSSLQELPRLWSSTSLENFGLDEPCSSQQQLEKPNFYVRELMPPISMTRLEAGSKLKRVSAIPGRRRSGEANFIVDENVDMDAGEKDLPGSTQAGSQTVTILAELAAEGNMDSQSGNEKMDSCQSLQAHKKETSLIVPECQADMSANGSLEATGFYMEDPVISVELDASSLSGSYTALVDDSKFSDLLITCQQGKEFKAHKLILHARCPEMLPLVKREGGRDVIDLSSYGEEAVLCLLKYVYGGQVSLFSSSLEEVRALAERFSLKSLANFVTSTQERGNSHHLCDSEVESKGEAKGTDCGDDEDDEVDENEAERESDFDDNDWLDVFQTQRENLKKKSVPDEDQYSSSESQFENLIWAESCDTTSEEVAALNTKDCEDIRKTQVEPNVRDKRELSVAISYSKRKDMKGSNETRKEMAKKGHFSIEDDIANWGQGNYTVCVREEQVSREKSCQSDEAFQRETTTEIEAESAELEKQLKAIIKEEDTATSTKSTIEAESEGLEKELRVILKEEEQGVALLSNQEESVNCRDERGDFQIKQCKNGLSRSDEKDPPKVILFSNESVKKEEKDTMRSGKEENFGLEPLMMNETSPLSCLHGGNIDITEESSGGKERGCSSDTSFTNSQVLLLGITATPTPKKRKKVKVSANQFKKIVSKVSQTLPATSGGSSQAQASDVLTDDDINTIAIKIEQDFQTIFCDDPNDSFYLPSVLDAADIDSNEIEITHAHIEEPRMKPRRRLGTGKGEALLKSLSETVDGEPCKGQTNRFSISVNSFQPQTTESLAKANHLSVAVSSNKKALVGARRSVQTSHGPCVGIIPPHPSPLSQMGQEPVLTPASSTMRRLLRESILSKPSASERNVDSCSSSEDSQLNSIKKLQQTTGFVQCKRTLPAVLKNTYDKPEPLTQDNKPVEIRNKLTLNDPESSLTAGLTNFSVDTVSSSLDNQNLMNKANLAMCDEHFSGDDLFSDEEDGENLSCPKKAQIHELQGSSSKTEKENLALSEGSKSIANQLLCSKNGQGMSEIKSNNGNVVVDPANEISSASIEKMMDKVYKTKKSVGSSNECPLSFTKIKSIPTGSLVGQITEETYLDAANKGTGENPILSTIKSSSSDELNTKTKFMEILSELIIEELNSQMPKQNLMPSNVKLTSTEGLVKPGSSTSAQPYKSHDSSVGTTERKFTRPIKKSTPGPSTLSSSQIIKKNEESGNCGKSKQMEIRKSQLKAFEVDKKGNVKQLQKVCESRPTGSTPQTPEMLVSASSTIANSGKQDLSLSQMSSNSDTDLSIFMDEMEKNPSPLKDKSKGESISKRKLSSPDEACISSKSRRVIHSESLPAKSPVSASFSKTDQQAQPSVAKPNGQSIEILSQSKKNMSVCLNLSREELTGSSKNQFSKEKLDSKAASLKSKNRIPSPEKAKTNKTVTNTAMDEEIIYCKNLVKNKNLDHTVSSHLSDSYKSQSPKKHSRANISVSPGPDKTKKVLSREYKHNSPDNSMPSYSTDNYQSPDKCHTPKKPPEINFSISPGGGKTRRGLAKKNNSFLSSTQMGDYETTGHRESWLSSPIAKTTAFRQETVEAENSQELLLNDTQQKMTTFSPRGSKEAPYLKIPASSKEVVFVIDDSPQENELESGVEDIYETAKKVRDKAGEEAPTVNKIKCRKNLQFIPCEQSIENTVNKDNEANKFVAENNMNHQPTEKISSTLKTSPKDGSTDRKLSESLPLSPAHQRKSHEKISIKATPSKNPYTSAKSHLISANVHNVVSKNTTLPSSQVKLANNKVSHPGNFSTSKSSPSSKGTSNPISVSALGVAPEKLLMKDPPAGVSSSSVELKTAQSPVLKSSATKLNTSFRKHNLESDICLGQSSSKSPSKSIHRKVSSSQSFTSPVELDFPIEVFGTGDRRSNKYPSYSHSPKLDYRRDASPKQKRKISAEIDMNSPLPLRQRLGLLNPFHKKPVEEKGQTEASTNCGDVTPQFLPVENDQIDLTISEIKDDEDGGFIEDGTDDICVKEVKAAEQQEIRASFEASQPKTPVNQAIHKLKQKKKKEWKEPSPFTPMAPYDSMDTPQLKKAVTKIGARPVGKKRMRELLKHVYHETHQYETDSDYDGTPLKSGSNVAQSSKIILDSETAKHATKTGKKAPLSTNCEPPAKKKKIKNAKVSNNTEKALPGKRIKIDPQTKLTTGVNRKRAQAKERYRENIDVILEPELHKQPILGDDQYEDIPASQDSSYSDGPDLPEESILQGWPDEEIGPSQLTQSSPEAVTEKLVRFVSENRDVYESILMYEPLELDILKKRVADAGIRVSMEKVMDFLDERCITFTMKNMSSRNNNRQRRRPGPKKTTSSPSKKKFQTK